MPRMKANYLRGLVLLVLAVNLAFGQEWHSLFDGQDLGGWKTGDSTVLSRQSVARSFAKARLRTSYYGPNGKAESGISNSPRRS